MKRVRLPLVPIAIFFLALGVRVLYNLTVAKGYMPTFDAGQYQHYGLNLAYTHHYTLQTEPLSDWSIAKRAPLWPFIIGAMALVFGSANFFPRLFYCFLGAGSCLLVYSYARDLFGRRIGLLAGSMAALYAGMFIYDGWLYSESLFTFMQLAFSYTLLRYQRTKRLLWAILSGLFIALASLTRPNGVSLLALVVVWSLVMLWQQRLSLKKAVQAALIMIVVGCAVIAPWTIRNYLLLHRFVPVALGSGPVLRGAYNSTTLHPNSLGDMPWMPKGSPMAQSVWINLQGEGLWLNANQKIDPLTVKPGQDFDQAIDLYTEQWVFTHLSDMPRLLALRLINTFTPYTSENGLPMVQFPTRISSIVVWDLVWYTTPLVLLLAAGGLIATWRRWRHDLLPVYLIMLLTIGTNLATYGSSRFRAPMEPLFVILAAGFFWWLCTDEPGTRRYRRRHKQQIK